MSVTANGNNDDDSDEIKPSANPFLAALVGAVFLSSDPGVTVAAQGLSGGWGGMEQAVAGAPTIVVAAAAPATTDEGLKSLLGEVS